MPKCDFNKVAKQPYLTLKSVLLNYSLEYEIIGNGKLCVQYLIFCNIENELKKSRNFCPKIYFDSYKHLLFKSNSDGKLSFYRSVVTL